MKKLLSVAIFILCVSFFANAGDKYVHDVNVLPLAARNELKKNFKSKVSLIKIDKEFGRVSEYEVVLTDGSEISYDKNGNWKNVETSQQQSVPEYYIPANVRSYLKKQHPGTRVVGIERERRGYDVELNNGIDLKFDKNGNFLRYDD